MDVPVDLSRIVIQDTSDQQIIFLREHGGEREFPIVIGDAEACAIDRRLKGYKKARPMTHDLLADVIEKLSGELEKIVGLSQSALSQHLARLRRDKMVTTRRNAQTIYYSLAGSLPRSLVDSLTNVFGQYTNPSDQSLAAQ